MSQIWRTLRTSISALTNADDHFGKAFIIAADTGDLDKMLEHIGNRGVSYQDEYGQRPLHRASRRGHAAAVRMLLEYGSDPNACDHVGAYTAIQYAAHYQHSEVVRLLVSYGADVYYQNRIACRPATYYAHKFPSVHTAIQQGTSDLYIHRSIAATFLIDHLDLHYFEQNDALSLKHSIALIIIEFIPRHQLWTESKTRYITNKTTNWHSSDLFSQKHREQQKQNAIHSCKYHGEFDIDRDWEQCQSNTSCHDTQCSKHNPHPNLYPMAHADHRQILHSQHRHNHNHNHNLYNLGQTTYVNRSMLFVLLSALVVLMAICLHRFNYV